MLIMIRKYKLNNVFLRVKNNYQKNSNILQCKYTKEKI